MTPCGSTNLGLPRAGRLEVMRAARGTRCYHALMTLRELSATSLVLLAACGGKVTSDPTAAPDSGSMATGGAGLGGSGLGGSGLGGAGHGGSGVGGAGLGGSGVGGSGIGGTSGIGAAAGASGSGATGGTGGAALGGLGSRCDTTANCSAPLSCWNGSDYPIGPARGICTLGCNAEPTACGALAPGAVCQDVFGVRVCLESCVPDGGNTSFIPGKCQARPELSCVYTGSVGWACMPSCNTDGDCSGKHCSPKTGLCQATAVSGAKTGAPCKSWDDCRGACLLQGAKQVCADRCTIGAPNQCGWQGPGTKAEALCLLKDGWSGALTGNPESVGDYGYCAATCNCDADCATPGLHCTPLDDPALAKSSLMRGFCTTKTTGPKMVCDE